MSLKNAFSVSHFYDRHFLVFTYSTTYQRHISGNRRVKELNLSEPFRAHRNNLHSYHNCIRGKYSSRSETAMFEIAFATTLYNFMRTFYRLRQTSSQVYCRKLAQCAGFEPTRRINARRLSKPFQYHYGNTAKLTRCTRSKATKRIWIFSSCPVRTAFVVLPTRSLFVVRLFYNHSHTPVKEYARPIVGIAGIEPATTRI